MNYKLVIGWLYPELMSTYGDRGNIIVLTKRCEWRGITIDIKSLDIGYSEKELQTCDLLFMGGAQDRQQSIVAEDLKKKSKVLKEMIEEGIPGLYICGAYQFLGKYYKEADGTIINGLGILDLYTESPGVNAKRLIGNIITKIDLRFKIYDLREKNILKSYFMNHNSEKLVGFENHGGRTYLGKNIKPFGTALSGYGNNGKDKTEGAVYKNSFGTYLHGPILPKNPHFADYLLKLALERKYKLNIKLNCLNDDLEFKTHDFIVKKYFK